MAGAPAKNGSLPTLSLPKGGGAIRGIGEKFSANPVTGTGTMTVQVSASPGRSGFGPELAMTYNSGSETVPLELRVVDAADRVRSRGVSPGEIGPLLTGRL